MVGVAVATIRFKSENDLRLLPADDTYQARHHFLGRRVAKRLGMIVIARTCHPRITVTEENYFGDAQCRSRTIHFLFPHLRQRFRGGGTRPLDFACFPPRCYDEDNANAGGRVAGQRSARAQNFVVRMGENAK
jgi:hypothetical protein